MLGTLSENEGQRTEEEEGQGEESYRSRDRSELADLKIDQLNAFRVNSKRDVLG